MLKTGTRPNNPNNNPLKESKLPLASELVEAIMAGKNGTDTSQVRDDLGQLKVLVDRRREQAGLKP